MPVKSPSPSHPLMPDSWSDIVPELAVNVGGACCDGLMTKRHHRGRQDSRRSLTPIPTPSPPGDRQKISNRYTEEVRWEILLLEPVNDWFLPLAEERYAVYQRENREKEQ